MVHKQKKRLNARLDDETAEKIAFLQKTTAHNTTDVIRIALELYYKTVRDEQTKIKSSLLESAFVGCVADDPNLSEDYKSLLSKNLSSKHGHR